MKESYKDAVIDVFSGGGIIVLGFIFDAGLSFLFKVVAARYLGPVRFGVLSLGIAILSLSTLALFGLDRGLAMYLPRRSTISQKRGLILFALAMSIPVGLLVGGIIYWFADEIAMHLLHDPDAGEILRVFAIVIPFLVLVRLTVGTTRGMKLSRPKVALQNIIIPISRIMFVVAVVLLGLGTLGVAWAYALSFVTAGIMACYYLITETPVFTNTKPELHVRELVQFSLPLMVVTMTNMLMTNIDTLMLGFFTGSKAIGIYNSVLPLARLSTFVFLSFNFIVMPVLSEQHADGNHNQMQSLYGSVSKWIFILTYPVALLLVVFPEFALGTVFGAEYAGGALALAVIVGGFFTNAIAGPNEDSLAATGRSKILMYDSLFVVLLNMVLNLVLAPRFGVVGVSVATAISFVVLNLIYGIQLFQTEGIQPFSWESVKLIVVSLALFPLARVVYIVTGDSNIVGIGILGVTLLVYAIIVFMLGAFGEEERFVVEAVKNQTG